MPKNDPFNDFDDEDEDDYLTFEESDSGGVRQGPIIIAAVLLLLAVFAAIAFVYLKGDGESETPQIAAQTEEFKETPIQDSVNGIDAGADVYNTIEGAAPPPLEVEATTPSEDPLVSTSQVAAPVAKAPAPVVTAPRPVVTEKPAVTKTVAVPPAAKPVTKPVTKPTIVAAVPKPEVKIASATTAPKPVAQKSSATGHAAQLGSFTSRAAAEAALAGYKADGLGGDVGIVAANLGEKGTWYRIRANGFASREEAVNFCSVAKSSGAKCIPTN